MPGCPRSPARASERRILVIKAIQSAQCTLDLVLGEHLGVRALRYRPTFTQLPPRIRQARCLTGATGASALPTHEGCRTRGTCSFLREGLFQVERTLGVGFPEKPSRASLQERRYEV